MPVAADHVKKVRAPGVLESLDQLRADRKKAVQAAKPKYITHDPATRTRSWFLLFVKRSPRSRKCARGGCMDGETSSKVPDAQTLQGLTLGLRVRCPT